MFNARVRVPGEKFLASLSGSAKINWAKRDYWRRSLVELYKAYGGICAYSAQWIPSGTGNYSVDHFLPKASRPDLAYEWSNYRLVCLRLNGRKSNYTDVLDPFTLDDDWFHLDFDTLLIKPNATLAPQDKESIIAAIERLGLNDDLTFVYERASWLCCYCSGAEFTYLEQNAPFIAAELERQGLVVNIKARCAVFASIIYV